MGHGYTAGEGADTQAMCGICGIIRFDLGVVDRDSIGRMNDIAAHRGPDGEGVFLAPGLGLGHRRLAILDLNPRGRQPMSWDGGRFQIVFNGEVYNYLEIRAELESLGKTFSTGTDTEVILAAYATWGEACLNRFNGMWAFAIFDSEKQTVFLARDRFGVKPLYYTETAEGMSFASEIKQLLPQLPRIRADHDIVLEWLLTGFEDHRSQTPFAGVLSLPASHSMHVDLRSGERRLKRWYQLRQDRSIADLGESQSIDYLRSLLTDAVKLRLRSDVQVGTCLSGGLDSSVTSVLASRLYRQHTGRRFLGIHARATEANIDESRWARMIADSANIDLVVVTPSTQDFLDTIDDVMWTQEEPFGSASMFMGWHVFRAARQHGCPVMLNGQGGDEVLLGYERYFSAASRELPFWRAALDAWYESRRSRLTFWDALRYKIYFLSPTVRIARLKSRSYLRSSMQERADVAFVKRSAEAFNKISELQRFEIETVQLPHLLRYEDRNSMRHGIETRLPFLDYRVVEAGLSMPTNLKLRAGWTKWVLRRATSEFLPPSVVWRTDKVGFEAPMQTWLADARSTAMSAVADSRIISETCDRDALLKEWDGIESWQRWRYFCLASWERVFGVQWS